MDLLPRLRRSAAGRLLGQSVVYGMASVVGKAAALLTVPYLTRQLSADGYGLAELATSFAALVTLVGRFGGDIPAARMTAIARDASERRRVLGSYVFTTAGVSSLVALALLPFGAVVAGTLWASPSSSLLALLCFALVPISATQAALLNVQRFESRSRNFAALAMVDLVAQLAFAVGLVAFGLGPTGVVLGFVLGSVVGVLAAGFASRSLLSVGFDRELARRLLSGGLPFLPAMAAFVFADSVARILAANMLGIREVGYLAVAIRISSVMALASAAFAMAWGPYGLGLHPGVATARLFRLITRSYVAILIVGSVALSAMAPEAVVLIAGEAFRPATDALPGLLLSGGMAGLLYVFATAAGISRRGGAAATSSLLGAAVQIGLTILLTPDLGITGVGIAAVGGRLAALAVIARGVSGVVDGTWPTLISLIVGCSLCLVVSAWLTTPDSVFQVRLLVVAVCVVAGLSVVWVGLRRLPPAT